MKIASLIVSALLVLSSLAQPSVAQLKLNEILADPTTDWNGDGSVSSKLDEWVEIANVGGSSIDLAAYRISDLSAGVEFRFALSGELAPGAVRVIYGSEVNDWQQANGVGAFGFSLNNSGDTLYLYRINGSDTTVVDELAYGSADMADDRAVGRYPSGDGDWVIFDGLNPLASGGGFGATGCVPSPGLPAECTTPVDLSSWGRIKSQFNN